MQEFRGKIAVVTGAASGIGFALAERLASEGVAVVLADIEGPALEEAAGRLRSNGTEVLKSREMTLIAAVQDDDSVLVAADSLKQWPTEGYRRPGDKLRRLGQSVIWGYSGWGSADVAFRQHLGDRTFHTWDQLEYHVRQAAELLAE